MPFGSIKGSGTFNVKKGLVRRTVRDALRGKGVGGKGSGSLPVQPVTPTSSDRQGALGHRPLKNKVSTFRRVAKGFGVVPGKRRPMY